MGFFDIFRWQTKDIIRWENPSADSLIFKWDQRLDEIKNNSSLIVDPGLAAIFVHNWKIEAIQKESGKWSLETDNIPFISTLTNIMSGFETHDKAAVYFIKTSKIANQKWGTPNSVTYMDPTYNFPVELRAFGNFTFRIKDTENFWINYVANQADVLTDDVRMLITDRIVWNIATLFAKKKISYNEIDAHTLEISKDILEATKEEFEKLWLELSDFRIEDINFTEETEEMIKKITSKSADVAAINKTAGIDKEAMKNYSDLEKLDIMWKAAENGGTAGDMMWAGMGMAMWMNMAKDMNTWNTQNKEEKVDLETELTKLKSLLEKELITKEEYEAKKTELLKNS